MGLIVNIIIIAAIFGFAGYQIYRAIKRSRQGKCAACDYDCEVKRMADKAKKKAF
ncbi:FeoB-associated Cys-rich membrane protein [Secundilactobacillus folii]|uniref:FeoB-associated Cys-rich membrane protein n=1 Tax=Secundilactobacillus folii TaxID=2678357 RepID=A0A7X2XW57_9LACO|nr:FeoB-associated Cys-rich membrane protein [Secundilactobacillus folii]MTV82180.1 FeoB-associated Cys-rich membrane protein [Secundilactobacillus folii]